MMYRFKNGDFCPCCGEKLEGKSEEWLRLFSTTCDLLGLRPFVDREETPAEIRYGERGNTPPSPQRAAGTPPLAGEDKAAGEALMLGRAKRKRIARAAAAIARTEEKEHEHG